MTRKYIKEKWQEVRAAKVERKNAEQEIVRAGIAKQPNVCISNVIVAGGDSSTMYPAWCDNFDEHKICDNVNCPMHTKNMHYVLANEKYKKLRQDFFKMLFCGREKNS